MAQWQSVSFKWSVWQVHLAVCNVSVHPVQLQLYSVAVFTSECMVMAPHKQIIPALLFTAAVATAVKAETTAQKEKSVWAQKCMQRSKLGMNTSKKKRNVEQLHLNFCRILQWKRNAKSFDHLVNIHKIMLLFRNCEYYIKAQWIYFLGAHLYCHYRKWVGTYWL